MATDFAVRDEVREVCAELAKAGFEAYLVGGCVRDMILKREPKDWDVATNAKPEEILKLIEMYAIVEIAGQQMKVEKGRKIYVHRLENAEGESVVFDKVLLVDDEGAVKVGTPVVEGASITATVLEHMKGDKVLVFKKKRRKGYQKMNGHRQYLTKIQIEEVIG